MEAVFLEGTVHSLDVGYNESGGTDEGDYGARHTDTSVDSAARGILRLRCN